MPIQHPDLRLKQNPTEFTSTLDTTGVLVPRSGNHRVVITDVWVDGDRPVFLRQWPSGETITGIHGHEYLVIPTSGHSHFISPPISERGVNIFNVNESGHVTVNYYYFEEKSSYFDTNSQLKLKFSMVVPDGYPNTNLNNISGTITAFDKQFSIVGSGVNEWVIADGDGVTLQDLVSDPNAGTPTYSDEYSFQIDVSGDGGINHEADDPVYFRGHNMPFYDGESPYIQASEGQRFRYWATTVGLNSSQIQATVSFGDTETNSLAYNQSKRVSAEIIMDVQLNVTGVT